MSNSDTFYLTTAIPYVNGRPHLGHVLEWMQADAMASYQRMLGKEVRFASGADENSLKNVQAAEQANVPVQDWLNEYSEIFREAYKKFDISLTDFQRGSDKKRHWPGVQKLWQLCHQSDDLYKKQYKGLYCVGCECFYKESELEDGNCPEHLRPPEVVEEENYFFKLSKYQDQVRDLIANDDVAIVSERYKNEMLAFIDQGLEDFSVSRSVERARGVGVPVPTDPTQVMYVWFDALSIYLTAIGWGREDMEDRFDKFWPADVHVIGKGINRFHSIYWLGMLLSAGLELPKTISVHGYITAEGHKMSKSLGNVIDPYQAKDQYGLEPLRYFLLRSVPTHNDGDFSDGVFHDVYAADLANGIGNLASRISTMAEQEELGRDNLDSELVDAIDDSDFTSVLPESYRTHFENYEINLAAENMMLLARETDQYLNKETPWNLEGEAKRAVLIECSQRMLRIGAMLQPFAPKAAAAILEAFTQTEITKVTALFPRLD